MSGRSDRRPQNARTVGRKVFIFCEDSKTAPSYFQGLRQSLRLQQLQVNVVSPPFTDPLNIVRAAIEARKNEISDRAWNETEGDLAWAVFDGDEHIENDPANWHAALDLAQARKIELAICNPAFEFWYLLHFEECQTSVSRQEALRRLKEHLPRYEKSDRLFPLLQPNTKQALERAEELERLARLSQLAPHANPCCKGVARLVGSLLELNK